MKIPQNELALISAKNDKILKCLKIKILIFTIIEIILILFFTYYIAIFCAVYKGAQISWILDSFISFILTNLFQIPLGFFQFSLFISIKVKIGMFI